MRTTRWRFDSTRQSADEIKRWARRKRRLLPTLGSWAPTLPARRGEPYLKPAQRHGFDHVIRALLQDQRRPRSGRQNILLQIGEVGPLPDRQRGRGRFLVG